jgi:hypothetical protein
MLIGADRILVMNMHNVRFYVPKAVLLNSNLLLFYAQVYWHKVTDVSEKWNIFTFKVRQSTQDNPSERL